MKSLKPVIISPQALHDLDATYEWILFNFGKVALQKFHNKWLAFLNIVQIQPALFPYLNKQKGLRKYTLHRRNIVIYRNTRTHIDIVAIFNTWQNPQKLRQL